MTRWITILFEGERLHDIGVERDGTLWNPRGYPEDRVRAAVALADGGRAERRSRAAKRAAETRRRRVERTVYAVSRAIVAGHTYGPRLSCVVCGKGLGDPQSIERGIGSDCWQRVLDTIERNARERAAAP
jgi:Family of unknown function (DUF6011)